MKQLNSYILEKLKIDKKAVNNIKEQINSLIDSYFINKEKYDLKVFPAHASGTQIIKLTFNKKPNSKDQFRYKREIEELLKDEFNVEIKNDFVQSTDGIIFIEITLPQITEKLKINKEVTNIGFNEKFANKVKDYFKDYKEYLDKDNCDIDIHKNQLLEDGYFNLVFKFKNRFPDILAHNNGEDAFTSYVMNIEIDKKFPVQKEEHIRIVPPKWINIVFKGEE